MSLVCQYKLIATGPLTHSVGGRLVTVADVCRRRLLSLSVGICNTRVCNVAHQGQHAMAARDGGPVVLRVVSATDCYTGDNEC